MVGMEYEEYWNGDPALARYYREAYNRKLESQNYMLWLNGVYTRDALIDALTSCFSKHKPSKAKYPKEPYPITASQKERQEKAKRDEQIQKLVQMFDEQNKLRNT